MASVVRGTGREDQSAERLSAPTGAVGWKKE